jgi:hypothetical protein
MSSGRYLQRGRVFQSYVFRPWLLAGLDAAENYTTTRVTLSGCSQKRIKLIGPSKERLVLNGCSKQRLTLNGAVQQ